MLKQSVFSFLCWDVYLLLKIADTFITPLSSARYINNPTCLLPVGDFIFYKQPGVKDKLRKDTGTFWTCLKSLKMLFISHSAVLCDATAQTIL